MAKKKQAASKEVSEKVSTVRDMSVEEKHEQIARNCIYVDKYLFEKELVAKQLSLFLIALDPTPKQKEVLDAMQVTITDASGKKMYPRD